MHRWPTRRHQSPTRNQNAHYYDARKQEAEDRHHNPNCPCCCCRHKRGPCRHWSHHLHCHHSPGQSQQDSRYRLPDGVQSSDALDSANQFEARESSQHIHIHHWQNGGKRKLCLRTHLYRLHDWDFQ